VQSRSVSSPADPQHTGRWLLLAGASIVLILYGSLFPFRVRTDIDGGFFELIKTLEFKPTTRGDIIANLLLYLPLGLCLMFAWSGRARWPALARAMLIGTALAVAVEPRRARPKSMTRVRPWRLTKILEGLMSRCSTPCSWAK